MAAALSYLFTWVTGLIFYLVENDNEYVRFHALQSILLGVAYIIGYIALTIVFGIIGTVLAFSGAFVGLRLMSTFLPLLSLAGLVLVGFMMYQAYQGNRFELPVIGSFAASKSPPSGASQQQQPPGGPGGHGGQYQQSGQGQSGQGTQYGGQDQPGSGQPGGGSRGGHGGQPGGGQPGGGGRGGHGGQRGQSKPGSGQPGQGQPGQSGQGRDSRSGQPDSRDDRRGGQG